MLTKNSISTYYNFFKEKLTKENRSEFFWFALGYLSNFILGFVILKILAQLGTSEYGKYALIITIVNFAGLTIFSPALQAFNRFYYQYNSSQNFNSFLKIINGFVTFSTASLLLITIAAFYFFPNFTENGGGVFIIFSGLYIIFIKLSEFASGLLNVKRKRKQNSFLLITEKSASVIILLILLETGSLELNNVLLYLSIILIILSSVKLYSFNNYLPSLSDFTILQSKTKIDLEIRKQLLPYSYPFIIWGIAFWLQTNGERWVIANYLTTSDVGIFSVMMSIANAAIAVPTYFLNDFFIPVIYGKFTDDYNENLLKSGYSFINLNTLGTVLLTVVSVAATYFYGSEIIILISSPEYISYSVYLPVICLGVGLFYVGHSMSVLGLALKKPEKYLLPKVATGIISILLYLFLIRYWGIEGIVIAILIIGFMYILIIGITNNKLKVPNDNQIV